MIWYIFGCLSLSLAMNYLAGYLALLYVRKRNKTAFDCTIENRVGKVYGESVVPNGTHGFRLFANVLVGQKQQH